MFNNNNNKLVFNKLIEEIQGTFLETGWFALVVGAFTLTSILGRLDFNLKFSKIHYLLYFFSLAIFIASS